MTLTQKETSLLSDLKSQEKLCIEKYRKYENAAKDPCLKELFASIRQTEENHLNTVNRIQNGEEVKMPASSSDASSGSNNNCPLSTANEQDKKEDAYLCADALAMEKHVSSVYDVSIFEFSSPILRDTLNHIQKEEQQHGEKIYAYMAKNSMYS